MALQGNACKEATKSLGPGYYDIKVDYYQSGGGASLAVKVKYSG